MKERIQPFIDDGSAAVLVAPFAFGAAMGLGVAIAANATTLMAICAIVLVPSFALFIATMMLGPCQRGQASGGTPLTLRQKILIITLWIMLAAIVIGLVTNLIAGVYQYWSSDFAPLGQKLFILAGAGFVTFLIYMSVNAELDSGSRPRRSS